MPTQTMTHPRRYYEVHKILTLDATGYEWLNIKGSAEGSGLGRQEAIIDGWNMKVWTGLPKLRTVPRLQLRARRKLLDFYGYGPFFISNRAKRLLSEIDLDAFDLVECETIDSKGERIEPYWMMAVKRLVQSFDEARSNFQTWAERFPDAPDAKINPSIKLNHLVMPADFPPSHHVFSLARFQTTFIADGTFVDAWRAAKLTGAIFTPLQEPSPAERRARSQFFIDPHWFSSAAPRPRARY